MSKQEKIASESSPVESNHSGSEENLSDVSASESKLVEDDTKSLIFGKNLMDETELQWMVTNRMLEKASIRLPGVRQLLSQSLMNVLFFGISLLLVFACHVKILLKKF